MKSPEWSCVLQKASIAARWDIPVQPKKQRRRQRAFVGRKNVEDKDLNISGSILVLHNFTFLESKGSYQRKSLQAHLILIFFHSHCFQFGGRRYKCSPSLSQIMYFSCSCLGKSGLSMPLVQSTSLILLLPLETPGWLDRCHVNKVLTSTRAPIHPIIRLNTNKMLCAHPNWQGLGIPQIQAPARHCWGRGRTEGATWLSPALRCRHLLTISFLAPLSALSLTWFYGHHPSPSKRDKGSD